MYQVTCDGQLVYDPRVDELAILSGGVSLTTNKSGVFEFELPITHPMRNKIKKLKSVIQVYDDNLLIFSGRSLTDEADFYNSGKITCEGELAYLLDSIQTPKEYHDTTPREYLEDKIAQHNAQVGADKAFTVGVVNVTNSTDNVYRIDDYGTTWDIINDKLLDRLGGYLRVRYVDTRYLDYITDYGRTCTQEIRFGENLLDLTQYTTAQDIKTAIIPIGADGLTIESVNDRKNYVYDEQAVAEYGWIFGTVEFENVTLPENLKAKAEDYLATAKNLALTIELSAVDLHLVDVDIDRILLGDQIRVISAPHGLDHYFTVSQRTYNLLDPSQDTITLGDTLTAMTDKQLAAQKSGTTAYVIANQAAQQARSAAAEAQAVENRVAVIEQSAGEYVKQSVFAAEIKRLEALINQSQSTTRQKIVEVAVAQLGNGRTKYCEWWGADDAWCAMFVCWCANEVGVLNTCIPRSASCTTQVTQWQSWGKWKGASYIPRPGDIIYYDWYGNGPEHVGIVETINGTTITVIEGNYSDTDKVARRTITTSYQYIYGYGTPTYPDE